MAKRSSPHRSPSGHRGDPVATVVKRLEGSVRATGDGWSALCPAHDDHDPSLSIRTGKDGRALLYCHAGCPLDRIVAALGLSTADLFPGDSEFQSRSQPSRSNALSAYASAKQLPTDFLRKLGLTDCIYQRQASIRIPYFDQTGSEVAIRFRIALDGTRRFVWRKGCKPLLYGLWRLADARRSGFVVLVEGESDCHTLWLHHIPALGLPGASTWREEWATYLVDIPVIYVLVEPDGGGEAVRNWVARTRFRDRVRLVDLGAVKDPSGLYVHDSTAFPDAWRAAIAAARPWNDIAREADHRAAAIDYEAARRLLHEPSLLESVVGMMQARGLAGDPNSALLAYLAITSRLLSRPLNLAFVGPSAAGKNRAIDAAIELMPAEAVYIERAGSPRAVIYVDAVFEHRTVVFTEADSIPEDGPGASAIRSLASDNLLAYDVVERDAQTGRHETRRIEKPGPTGLITTSTKSLPHQIGTRMLEVPVRDDPQQTRSVMQAHARLANSTQKLPPVRDEFFAVQRWLAQVGERCIVCPFSEVLADLVPPTQVRMRRDFQQLLTCIQVSTFLHQRQRRKTVDGKVIATLEDYAIARQLLAPIFDAINAEGLTPAVRATVEAIRNGEEVSQSELCHRLGLAKPTVSYRVNRALRGGWLTNNETRVNAPARLVRGAPLPDQTCALPSSEIVRDAFERSNQFAGHTDHPSCTEHVGEVDRFEEGML